MNVPTPFLPRVHNGRVYKFVPLKTCCICLRSIGFGYTFISNRIPKDKSLVRKWTRHISLAVKRRVSRQMSKPGPRSKLEIRAMDEAWADSFFRRMTGPDTSDRGNPLAGELERAYRRRKKIF